MEIGVFPRMFNVQPGKAPNPQGGEPIDTMILTFVDTGGTVVRVMLGLPDFEQFQAAIADHEAAAQAAAARSKIISPGGLAPTLKMRNH